MARARAALALTAAALLAGAGSDAASQSAPSAAPAAPADFVVVSRIDNTQTVEAQDLPIVLTKGKREEHAVVRRLLFISATLRLTQPPAPPEPEPAPPAASSAAPGAEEPEGPPPKQTCRWTYRAFLQRQICFTSMSGLSSCTQPEISSLPDVADGDAPISDAPQQGACNDIFRPAVNARIRMTSSLLSRTKELFAADQQAKVDAQFRAAGVRVTAETAATARPATSAR